MQKYVVTAAVFVFLAMAIGSSLTHRPQIDEGMFASPAYNLAYNSHFGTTVLATEKSTLTRISERTYWVMPIFLVTSAASFKLLGFSLFSMRFVSILFGLLLLAAVYIIGKRVSGDNHVGIFALIFTACDYMVLETASSARMDMMSAALGYAAIASYLLLRERSLMLAVLVSQSLIVFDGLTHPNAITACLGLLFLTLYLDRGRLSFKLAACAALPYLVGGSAFGIWVLQDPQAFQSQFIENALMGGRMSGMSSPLANLLREFTDRYPHAYGLGPSSSGHSGPIYLKSLILVGYLVGVLGVLAIRELRNDRKHRALLIVGAIYFVLLALIDGQKQTTYLIHIVPLYLILLGSVAGYFWRYRLAPSAILVAAMMAVIIIPLGGMALKIRQNTRGNYYDPVISFLKSASNQDDAVMAGADLAFGLGFEGNLIADGKFGYATGKRPRFIVTDSAADSSWESTKGVSPGYYEYYPRMLATEYRIAFKNAAYTVYEKR